MESVNVLISLHKGYGVGDAIQMSAVLQTVKKYRPNWHFDYQAEKGKEVVGRGIAHNVFAYGEPYPTPHYDAEVQICLYDTWANWGDRPNTRVSSALHDHFGLPWDNTCGRYVINMPEDIQENVRTYLRGFKWVGVHYQGDSSQERKNLTDRQADDVCRTLWEMGYWPLLLDFRDKSPLKWKKVTQRNFNGANAAVICAIISECKAFIGIDSGPGKCASATNTPTLITWTGHHPAPFHDPAPNTTHLVPRGYHGLEPVCHNEGVIAWFEANYNVRQYVDDPVTQISEWLREVLK